MRMKDVAFQGELGAYSHLACCELLGDATSTLPCRSFRDTFDAIEGANARFALVPAENSSAGTVHEVFDLLVRRQVRIVAEHFLRVEHCLLASPSTDLSSVRHVYSHPQALAQCERFLTQLGADSRAVFDTAGGARLVSRSRSREIAAIASELAGKINGLKLLKRGIQDQPNNVTRFLLLTHRTGSESPSSDEPRSGCRKTTIVFDTKHRPGALVRALTAFSDYGLNLTKIESRPIADQPFEYLFTVDVLSPNAREQLTPALSRLKRCARSVRVLGTYLPGVSPAQASRGRRRSRTSARNL